MIIDKTKKIHEQMTKETWLQGYMCETLDPQTKQTFRDMYGNHSRIEDVVKLCLVGWINAVYGRYTPASMDVIKRISDYLSEKLGKQPWNCLPDLWNDDPTRQYEEVHALCVELDI